MEAYEKRCAKKNEILKYLGQGSGTTNTIITATLTAPATTTATGTVNFRNAANASLANCAAATLSGTGITKTATCSITETSAGTKTYNALYSGDTNFNAGANPSASVTLTAPDVATTTTVTASATTLNYPNSPTLTATVAASASTVTGGTVTFKRLSVDVPSCVNLPLTTAGANKIATCTPASASLPVGAHSFTALYSGVVGFAASSGSSPSITINDPPPANNNLGSNSEANPVLVDAFYVHPDHLGTPRVVTNPADNKKIWEWESTPFGESAANENPQNGALPAAQFRYNLRFPRQVYDAETSKHYNYFRDYDPSVGRYLESDPIGLRGGVNTFGYGNQSPTVGFDPRGLAVSYTGSVTTAGVTVGMGGQLANFQFTSECKCDKQVTVEGFASFLMIGGGASLKWLGKPLKELSGTNGSLQMVDTYAECPDRTCANGPAFTSGVNAVAGAGGSFLVNWVLGRLRMSALADGPSYGFDMSATYTLFGWSAVYKSETKCCKK